MAGQTFPVQLACRVLGVSESGYYEHCNRAPCRRSIRHTMLAYLITQIHRESYGIDGVRRIHAELTLGCGVIVGHNQVELLMRCTGLLGPTGRRKWKRIRAADIATDLVQQDFTRAGPDQLWVADIERHEALLNRAVVEGHRPWLVAASRVKLRAA